MVFHLWFAHPVSAAVRPKPMPQPPQMASWDLYPCRRTTAAAHQDQKDLEDE